MLESSGSILSWIAFSYFVLGSLGGIITLSMVAGHFLADSRQRSTVARHCSVCPRARHRPVYDPNPDYPDEFEPWR